MTSRFPNEVDLDALYNGVDLMPTEAGVHHSQEQQPPEVLLFETAVSNSRSPRNDGQTLFFNWLLSRDFHGLPHELRHHLVESMIARRERLNYVRRRIFVPGHRLSSAGPLEAQPDHGIAGSRATEATPKGPTKGSEYSNHRVQPHFDTSRNGMQILHIQILDHKQTLEASKLCGLGASTTSAGKRREGIRLSLLRPDFS